MKKTFLVAYMLFLCLYATTAQEFGIQGTIHDAESGKLLSGATVQLLENKRIKITNESGRYIFYNVPNGSYTVKVTYVGYAPQTKKITLQNKTQTLHFKMNTLQNNLEQVVVTGTGTLHHIQSVPLMTEVIGKKFLKMYSGQSIEEILAGLSPSFDYNQNIMGSNIQMNGLGNQYILFLINGERINGDIGGQNLLGLINPADIEKIEIVKGASSSLYGSDAIAGVINIITKKEKAKISLLNSSRVASYATIRQNNRVSLAKGKWRSTTRFNLKHSDGWQNTTNEWFRKRIFHNSVTKTVNNYTDWKIDENIEFAPNDKFSANIDGNYYHKVITRPTGVPQYVTYGMTYKSHSFGARAKYKFNDKSQFSFNTNYNQTESNPDINVVLGDALLVSDQDIQEVGDVLLAAFKSNLNNGEAVAFMGHGNPKDEYNGDNNVNLSYEKIEDYMQDKYGKKVMVGTVDYEPMLIPEVLKEMQENLEEGTVVNLSPLMSIAGDHANNDMAGDVDAEAAEDEQSWKIQMRKAGYKVSDENCILKGLGDYPEIVNVWIRHTKEAIATNDEISL